MIWTELWYQLDKVIDSVGISWVAMIFLLGGPISIFIVGIVVPRWLPRGGLFGLLCLSLLFQFAGLFCFVVSYNGRGSIPRSYDLIYFFFGSAAVCWFFVLWLVLVPKRTIFVD